MEEKNKKISLNEYYEKKKEIKKDVIMPKILVGIATSVHKMYCLPQFMKGLKELNYPNMEIMIVDNSPDDQAMNFCRSMRELGHTVIHIDRVKYTRQNLVNSENYLLDYFIKHNEDNPDNQFEYFFSLESDVIPPPNVIQQLLKNQVSCVSGVYMNGKVYPPKQEGGHELHTWIPMAWQYPIDGIPELNVLRPMDLLKDVVPSRLIRVQSTGLGCLLIKKHVAEGLKKLGGFKVELDSVACFRKGTKILTNKEYVNIENVKENDEVWTHKDRFRKVLMSGKTRDYTGNMITITTEENKELIVTADHNCFIYNESKEQIKKANDLKIGDIVKIKEEYTKIKIITKEEVFNEPVFNLTIDEDHSIMTEAFVVKNCSDMFAAMSFTQICDNPKCGHISDKYIHKCLKCGGKCVWVYLDSSVMCRHDHSEWGSELRKFR